MDEDAGNFDQRSRRRTGAGVVHSEEQALVEQLVAHPTVEAFDKPFCIDLSGTMKCQSRFNSLYKASIALRENSVPLLLTISCSGTPW
jgi:hypothetical protein